MASFEEWWETQKGYGYTFAEEIWNASRKECEEEIVELKETIQRQSDELDKLYWRS